MSVGATAPVADDPMMLFDGQHLQVLHYAGTSPYSLVTFHVMHAVADGRSAFALRLAKKNDLDLIAFMPKSPNWYPADEMKRALRIVRTALNRPAIAYGASMGGYAALRYGKSLGCRAALAFSPQASIDPAVIGDDDPRYGKYFRKEMHAKMGIRKTHLAQHSYYVLDPSVKPDVFQAGLLPEASNLTRIELNYTGHKTVRAAASSATALAVFEAALSGQHHPIRRALGRNRKNAAIYHAKLAEACVSRGHLQWGTDISGRAIVRFGPDQELELVHARALARGGEVAGAVSQLQSLINRFPAVTKYRLELFRVHDAANDPDSALSVLDDIANRLENFPIHFKLLRKLKSHGRMREASRVGERAILIWPDRELMIRSALESQSSPAVAAHGP